MSDEGRTGRFRGSVLRLIVMYKVMAKLFAELPVPISLPESPLTEAASEIGLLALDRAQRHLIPDLPVTDEAKYMLQQVVLEWLTAWEMSMLLRDGGFTKAPWRLEVLEYALDRMSVCVDDAAERLGLDLDRGLGE